MKNILYGLLSLCGLSLNGNTASAISQWEIFSDTSSEAVLLAADEYFGVPPEELRVPSYDEWKPRLYEDEDELDSTSDSENPAFSHDSLNASSSLGERRTLAAQADFSPLSCNSIISDTCTPFETAFGSRTYFQNLVTIPCGQCITMKTSGISSLFFSSGLDIQGKLVFPEGAKAAIKTPFIFVQGELEMSSVSHITNTSREITVTLTGISTVYFKPHPENAASCPERGCEVGKKPIVIAGGKLNIRGMPEGCPTHIKMNGLARGLLPIPPIDQIPKPNILEIDPTSEYGRRYPNKTCTLALLDYTFEGEEGIGQWYGNTGANADHVFEDDGSLEGNHHLQISNRTKDWQGPILHMTAEEKLCFIPDYEYVFMVKVKLSRKDGVASTCSLTGQQCLTLRYTNMDSGNRIRWYNILGSNIGINVPDGTWYTFMSIVQFSPKLLKLDDVFSAITLTGPELEVDISIDDFYLGLPPLSSYPNPDPTKTCQNLVTNGNATSSPFPFPMRSWLKGDSTTVETEESTGDNYFHITGRKYHYSSITYNIIPACCPDKSLYWFSMDIRVHSVVPERVWLVLKTSHPEGESTPFHFNQIMLCPESSTDIGWVTCEVEHMFDETHSRAPYIEFVAVTKAEGMQYVDIDYKNLSFEFLKGEEIGQKLPGSEKCWGPGAEVLVSSQTIEYTNAQIVTLATVNNNGTVEMVEEEFITPGECNDHRVFTGEFSIMDRNIAFEADTDKTNALHGGHLIFLRTPNVEQLLDGVFFKNFGQMGIKSRYPINMESCGDNTGSVISRNLIWESNLRCISLQDTHNVHIKENVAHDTHGHCYALEDGSETGNIFESNLGSSTKRVTVNIGWESDHSPATFYMNNPANSWINNVAAGCDAAGFFLDLAEEVVGESAFKYPDVNPRVTVMTEFSGNVAHSNAGTGFQLAETGYRPPVDVTINNFYSFRNGYNGMYLRRSLNLIVDGGIIADNRWGIDLFESDATQIRNMEFIGTSYEYQRYVNFYDQQRHCWGPSQPQWGIKLYSSVQLFVEGAEPNPVKISNITFEGFERDRGCPNSIAMFMNKRFVDHRFTQDIFFESVYFKSQIGTRGTPTPPNHNFKLCGIVQAGITDILIPDLDGSMNPDVSMRGTEGVVISDTPEMDEHEECVTYGPGTCAKYCGFCYTKVTVGVETQGTENWQVKVVDLNRGNVTWWTPYFNGEKQAYWYLASHRYFTLKLPEGDYMGYLMEDGEEVYSNIIDIEIKRRASCPANFTMHIPQLVEPPFDGVGGLCGSQWVHEECKSLVTNGNFDEMDVRQSGWFNNGCGMKVVPGFTGNGVATKDRKKHAHGIRQFLDVRCFDWKRRYEIGAMVRVTDKGGNDWSCNPQTKVNSPEKGAGGIRCPRANILSKKGGITQDFITEYQWAMGDVMFPYKFSNWNLLIGLFTITPAMADAEMIEVTIEGISMDYEIHVDDVYIKYVIEDPNEIIQNGDFAIGDYRFWYFLGDFTGLEIVNNAEKYGEIGYSTSTNNRLEWWHSMAQDFYSPCLRVGTWWEVTAEYRLEDYNGNFLPCNPYLKYETEHRCPEVSIKIEFTYYTKDESYIPLGFAYGPQKPNDWNMIAGVFQVTEAMVSNKKVEIYVAKATAGRNVVVNNISVHPVTALTPGVDKTCNELIMNGDAELGDARFWFIKGLADMGELDIVSPGAGGSTFAFHHKGDRKRHYNGMWQTLVQGCMDVGSEWNIRAKFKLFNNEGTPVTCNKASRGGNKMCPMFFFQSHSFREKPHQTSALLNTQPGDWIADDWNDYQAVFTMTDDHKRMERTWVFIHNIPVGYTYMVDDISLTPA